MSKVTVECCSPLNHERQIVNIIKETKNNPLDKAGNMTVLKITAGNYSAVFAGSFLRVFNNESLLADLYSDFKTGHKYSHTWVTTPAKSTDFKKMACIDLAAIQASRKEKTTEHPARLVDQFEVEVADNTESGCGSSAASYSNVATETRVVQTTTLTPAWSETTESYTLLATHGVLADPDHQEMDKSTQEKRNQLLSQLKPSLNLLNNANITIASPNDDSHMKIIRFNDTQTREAHIKRLLNGLVSGARKDRGTMDKIEALVNDLKQSGMISGSSVNRKKCSIM